MPDAAVRGVGRRPGVRRRAAVAAAAALLVSLAMIGGRGVAAQATPTPPPASAPAPERIAGHLVQGTAGAELPPGLQVTLRVIDQEGGQVAELTAPVAPDGSFVFEELPEPGESNYFYRVSVSVNGLVRTAYYEDAPDPSDIELTIYETTPSPDGITVPSHSLVVNLADGEPGVLQVLELAEVVNSGDRTFMPEFDGGGTMPRLLRFGLPEGGRDLHVESDLPDQSVFQVESGFGLGSPVPPGRFQVLYRYSVDYHGTEHELTRSFPQGAEKVRALVSSDVGRVAPGDLSPSKDAVIGDSVYRVLQGGRHGPGSSLTLSLSGLPRASSPGSGGLVVDTGWLVVGLPSFLGAALAALVGYTIYRRRVSRPASAPEPVESRGASVAAIARLDERYEAGEIEPDAYAREREALVRRALAKGAAADGGRP